MKFTSVLFLAGAALVASQSIADLPTCAKECAGKKLMGNTCNMDPRCICADKSFLVDIAACVDSDCTTQDERDATINFAVNICKAVKIDIDTNLLPPTASTTSSTLPGTTAEATTTPTASGTAPSTTPTGSTGGKNDTIAPTQPGSGDEEEDDSSDSAAGRVGGSFIGVVAAVAGACLLL
ncbi:hypothetical protein BJ508DRAFT_418184 [Ascobolus immersus RN42]|uniref:CFEM domain-containing protein n=1 Tax=Ascobolus immersus RN42 TaxID=1160509 RepID=A0A3N4HPT0_ASCIM|nr:hypothetical protein BJ508DRAFT_418184 [Ascobolus immersus RN42]